jgi:dTDP-4-amino-4,6-dideoxygalactose transaminase
MNAASVIYPGLAHDEVMQLLENALALSRCRPARPVAFIEHKVPDLQQLAEILRLSSDSGSWTNFGPVCSLLESALERQLNLPPARAAVMCSSGTSALLTLIALHQYCAGRKLRWVISAYGFRSTYVGLLADATVLDSDGSAMLDLQALSRMHSDAWDGLVLTNVFGLRPDGRDYLAFCKGLGKELIVDNAGLLDGFQRDDETSSADEILSFHQTKPWGMGEGGCAIIARRDAPIFRELMNTGESLRPEARAGASNSKISDFSCALILQRLLHASAWSGAYREQAQRVLAIALEAGLRPLAPIDFSTLTPPHLPMLANHPVAETSLANETFVMRKYYQPLVDSAQNAWAIYNRIVNIPCHPGMAALSDEEICRVITPFGLRLGV